MLKTLSHSLLSIVYPQECKLCGLHVDTPDDGVACSACWYKTRIFDGNETLCIKCGAFLFQPGSLTKAANCRICEEQHFDRAFAVGVYEQALSASIIHLKRTPFIPRRIRRLLAAAAERIPLGRTKCMIPIPLSPRRRQERGFNQAQVIAECIAKACDLPLDNASLIRKVHTPMHRAGMDKKARAITVKNAFEVVRPKLIAGRDVLLIDDVLTSGETASVCARVLKKSGAARVNVLTIARAG